MSEPEYYRFNSLELSVGQFYAWQGLSLLMVGFLVQKLLRVAVPNVYWPHPSLIDVREGPPENSQIGDLLRDLVEKAAAERCEVGLYYSIPALNDSKTCAAALLSHDRRTLALCAANTTHTGSSEFTASQFGCFSRISSSQELLTTNARPFLPSPPFVDVVRLPGASVSEIVTRHRERIAKHSLETFEASPAKLLENLELTSKKSIAFLVSRGFLVPMSPDEVAEVRRKRAMGV